MPPQENNVPPVPPGNNPKPKKYHYPYAISAIIIFLILIGAAYLFASIDGYKSLKDNRYDKNIVLDQFANWKTYTNTEYGFEFKYPTKFSFDQSDLKISQVVTMQDYPSNSNGGGFDVPFGCAIHFSVEVNPNNLPLTEWIPKFTSINGSDTKIIIDNQQGIRKISTDDITNNVSVAIFVPKQDKVYFYSTQEPSCISKLNQILSTFKFISTSTPTTIDTSNWKTYTNIKYGYEIKYPQNFCLDGVDSIKPEESELAFIDSVFRNDTFSAECNPEKLKNPPLQPKISIRISVLSKADIQETDKLPYEKTSVSINDVNFTKITDNSRFMGVYTLKNDFSGYLILIDNFHKDDNEQIKIFDQILSTFKFTK